jgi:hypothetical protein
MTLLDIIDKAKKVPGAISVTEMIVIHNLVLDHLQAIDGLWAIDLGAHAGKSSMMASSAMSQMGRTDLFCMVDLIYNLDNPEWWNTYQGARAREAGKDVKQCIPWPIASDPRKFTKIQAWHNSVSNLDVNLFGFSSMEFLKRNRGPFSYAFIDTDDHSDGLTMSEAKGVEHAMAPGALVLFHDYGNYSGPIKAGEYLVATGKYEKIRINWNPARKTVAEHNLDEGNDSWAGPQHSHIGCFRRKK